MSDAPFKYRRLPGRGRRYHGAIPVAAARSSLWVGPDHLLSVDRVWMNEEYKRFYFRDIQAITVQQTRGATMWLRIFGALAGGSAFLFGMLASDRWSSARRTPLLVAGGILTALWLLLLLINFLRGPTCICRLRTAVQTEVLPSLGRVAAANRAIALVKPLIEQAQGTLSAEEIGAERMKSEV